VIPIAIYNRRYIGSSACTKNEFCEFVWQFYDATHNYTGVEGADDEAVRNRIEALTAQFFRQTLLWETL